VVIVSFKETREIFAHGAVQQLRSTRNILIAQETASIDHVAVHSLVNDWRK
jgi:hypothetical protein